jgi:diguanylate cyclase (GGDEF)-like protein
MPAECRETLGVEDRVVLTQAIHQLRDLERQVLVHFHFDAMSQTEIAAKLGISCNYVSHILRQSLAKLRRILANEDEQDRRLRHQNATIDDDVLDPITGVYSEDYLLARAQEEIHRASSCDGVMSLMAIDFDGLNELAAYYGPASVSDFIADAADCMRENVRRLDVLCRWGEYGFGVILRSIGPGAPTVVQRTQRVLDQWLSERHSAAGGITARVRVAVYPDEGSTLDELMNRLRSKPVLLEVVDGGDLAETRRVA